MPEMMELTDTAEEETSPFPKLEPILLESDTFSLQDPTLTNFGFFTSKSDSTLQTKVSSTDSLLPISGGKMKDLLKKHRVLSTIYETWWP